MTYADYCLEKAEKATTGPWWKGSWSGKCIADHSHGRDVCDYKYTKDTDIPCVSLPAENYELIGWDEHGTILSQDNAEFIASSREMVPELAKRLKKACEALDILTTQTRLCLPDDFESREKIEKAIRVLEELVAMPVEEK